MRDRTGHRSNALLRYEKQGTEQVLKVSECLGVPSNLNLSKDNVALPIVAMGQEWRRQYSQSVLLMNLSVVFRMS